MLAVVSCYFSEDCLEPSNTKIKIRTLLGPKTVILFLLIEVFPFFSGSQIVNDQYI